MKYNQILHVYQSPFRKAIQMNCPVYLPQDFKDDEQLPMIVFLHGAGERGTDPELVKIHGVGKYAARGDLNVRAVIITPQVPNHTLTWNHLYEEAFDIIQTMAEKYHVDESRISLTGLSMGGFGTWELGILHPDYFSALAPICGGGMSWRAGALKNVPIRAFHGDKDDTVEPELSQFMVDAVNRAGGNAQLTIFHDVGHGSWIPAYEDTNVIAWLTQQKRKG